MSSHVAAWRKVVEQVVRAIANEDLQRRAWFGAGPEEDSPDEMLNQFFGDAAIEEFLVSKDNGLDNLQSQLGMNLLKLMKELSKQTPQHIEPSDLIDDPRWRKIREAAAQFSAVLSN